MTIAWPHLVVKSEIESLVIVLNRRCQSHKTVPRDQNLRSLVAL